MEHEMGNLLCTKDLTCSGQEAQCEAGRAEATEGVRKGLCVIQQGGESVNQQL